MNLTETEMLRLLQLELKAMTDYFGPTDGTVDNDTRRLIMIALGSTSRVKMQEADELILVVKALGFNDNLIADGVLGEQFAKGIRKAFGIPEP